MTTVHKDGYARRVFDDYVQWYPGEAGHKPTRLKLNYCVARFPFVPGYHLCGFDTSDIYTSLKILSTHKTLHEALDIVRVLEGGYA